MSIQQSPMTVKAEGTVSGPPALSDVIMKLEESQKTKQEVILTVGEALVLNQALLPVLYSKED